MVVRKYIFLALERLQDGSYIRVTEKGLLFNSMNHARTFKVKKWSMGFEVRFNGVAYRLNESTRELEPFGEYYPHEGMQGALWE
jgi:hypothetical protein